MQTIATTLAATGDAGRMNLPYLVSLLAVVLSLIALFRSSMIKQNRNQPQSTPAPQPPPAPSRSVAAPSAPESIPPEILAVIAAAVASVTGNKPVRIISIKPMSTSWERAGRQSVLTSHRIR